MPTAPPERLVNRWVLHTWAGWVLGIPLIALLALAGEAVGIGGSQVLVGAGMGLGIGIMQARIIRQVLPGSAGWIWSCVVGLSIPFLITDLANLAKVALPYSLPVSVAAAGLIAGVWQSFLFQARARRTGSWIVASLVGWGLAAGSAAAADALPRTQALRGIPGLLAYLFLLTAGGLLLGIATRFGLARVLAGELAGPS